MRNPNGYGSVYKLSGNRRKPYIARVTTGWTTDNETGKKKQNYTTIGFYQDRQQAMQALSDYNDCPYNVDVAQKTFAEIYDMWYQKTYSPDMSPSTIRSRKASFKLAASIHNMRICDIKQRHLQDVLNEKSDLSYESVHKVQLLFLWIFRWCVDNDYLKKSYAENLKNPVKAVQNSRKAFSTEEIKFLWDNISQNEYIKIVLILIYSGVRINELLDLKIADIDFDEHVFYVRKSKTEAGIRTVPIADKVFPFWKEFVAKSKCSYAFTTVDGEHFTYDNFRKHYYMPLMKNLNLQHDIHETRHTCISQLTMNGADKTVIKWIVGHKSIMSLTERVYTHIENKSLLENINRIP